MRKLRRCLIVLFIILPVAVLTSSLSAQLPLKDNDTLRATDAPSSSPAAVDRQRPATMLAGSPKSADMAVAEPRLDDDRPSRRSIGFEAQSKNALKLGNETYRALQSNNASLKTKVAQLRTELAAALEAMRAVAGRERDRAGSNARNDAVSDQTQKVVIAASDKKVENGKEVPKVENKIPVKCNLKLPSCRKWLFLQKKKLEREKQGLKND